MAKILIIEDNNDINNILKTIMPVEHSVKQAFAGSEGKHYFETEDFDLVLLDLMLPGINGEELITHFKALKACKIIIITAKADINVLVDVLNLGADDYIAKPFNNQEVIARVNKHLQINTSPNVSIIKVGNLSIDDTRHEVILNDKILKLRQKEYEIIKLLMQSPNQVFTKANLYENIWHETYYGDDNTISVHISRLRNKLKNEYNQDIIETIWGVGFKLKVNE